MFEDDAVIPAQGRPIFDNCTLFPLAARRSISSADSPDAALKWLNRRKIERTRCALVHPNTLMPLLIFTPVVINID